MSVAMLKNLRSASARILRGSPRAAYVPKRTLIRDVPVAKLLMGGDAGIDGERYARMLGQPLRASTRVIDGPHAQFLREYAAQGQRLLHEGPFEATAYYRNAAACIEFTGSYFDARQPDQVRSVAARYVAQFEAATHSRSDANPNSTVAPKNRTSNPQNNQAAQQNQSPAGSPILVRPIAHSTCFQVKDGHHRVAMAATLGQSTVDVESYGQPVFTPLQRLLLDNLWLQGRRELYQPIDAPELADDWTLVRRCTDRLDMMRALLAKEGLLLSSNLSYVDLGAAYGWFVAKMRDLGFHATGVERDPFAIEVGQWCFSTSLNPDSQSRMIRSDLVRFLNEHQSKRFDVVSAFSVLHHFALGMGAITPEQLIGLLDGITGRVLFIDTGEAHESWFADKLPQWTPNFIDGWLRRHTSFSQIVRLGVDGDAVTPYQDNYGRTLFACIR